MRRSVWVHQWNQLVEQTPQEIADTLLPRRITGVYIKAMDGFYWMGDVYSHRLVPRDATSMADLVDQFEAVGLTLVPWVVPRSLANEAHAHVECGAAARDRLIIDWEYHYQGFWMGSAAQAQEYHDTLRAGVQAGMWIASAPDPRQIYRDYDPSLIRGLSAILPQTYWTDFQADAFDVVHDAILTLAQFGPVEPIMPYNATPADMERALVECLDQEVQAVSLWRMGSANAAQLDAFAVPISGDEEPEEATDVDDAERRQYQEKIDGLVNAFGYLTGDALRPLTRPTAAKYVKTFVAEARRVAEQVQVEHA